MKKFLLMAFVAMFAIVANAQVTWTASSLPEDGQVAQELGWPTIWAGYPITPADYLLCEGDGFKAYLENPSLAGPPSQNKTFNNILFMGSQNTDRNGIQSLYFYEGLENNDYVRTGTADDDATGATDTYYYTIVTMENDTYYGSVMIEYSRGDNLSAMYVVDATANNKEGMMVLQSQTRSEGTFKEDGETKDNKTHVARFGVAPGRTYYIMSSDANIELYALEFTPVTADSYQNMISSEDYPVYWDAHSLPEDGQAAQDIGWNTIWGGDPITPADYTLCEGEGFKAYLENPSICYAPKYNKTFDMGLIMGMNNSSRTGIESLFFYEGLENNDYVYSDTADDDVTGASDTFYYTIVTVTNDTYYGKVAINYSRGDNLSAMYVVDATANDREGMMVLQSLTHMNSVTDAEGKSLIKTHIAEFGVVPGHTYYIMASEKLSVELYTLGFCPVTASEYENEVINGGDVPSGIQNVTTTKTTPNDGKIYSIDGRYVGTETGSLSKGVYIMNGQKFIVK